MTDPQRVDAQTGYEHPWTLEYRLELIGRLAANGQVHIRNGEFEPAHWNFDRIEMLVIADHQFLNANRRNYADVMEQNA